MSDYVDMFIDAAPVDMTVAGAQGSTTVVAGGGAWSDLTGTANYLPFDLTPTGVPTQTGTMSWNATEGVVDLQLGGGVTLQIGSAEQVEKCHNGSGSAIAEGKVVYVSGSTGDALRIALASSASDTTSKATLGLVTETGGISNGSEGFVTLRGKVRGINTNAFNAGDELWLTTAGDYTNTKPSKATGPNHTVRIGYVVKKAGAGAGIIFVDPIIGGELGDVHDVSIGATPSNLDVLTYELATGLWKNQGAGAIIAGAAEKTTPVDADQLGITDSADAGAFKRLTFANLWTWVKSKLDAALTIAGTKTFSGQIELTGQSATNATSAMTRALSDSRYGSITVMRIESNKDITALSLTDISGTTVSLDANSEYEISGFLAVETTGGSPTNRVQFRIAYSGTTQTVQGVLANITTTGGMFPMVNGTLLTTGFADTNNVDRTFPVFAHIRTNTSGNFTLQAYRISGGTVNPKLLAGSVLIFRKIP